MTYRTPSPWDDDDPAVQLGRAYLRRRHDPPPTAEPAVARAAPAPPRPPTRRERIAALLARVRAGDYSAADQLRGLLGE